MAVALLVGVALGSTIACSGRDSLVRSRRPAVITAPLAVDAANVVAPNAVESSTAR